VGRHGTKPPLIKRSERKLLKKSCLKLANMVITSLGKKMFEGKKGPSSRQESTAFLTTIFDRNHDGSMTDDILGMAFKSCF